MRAAVTVGAAGAVAALVAACSGNLHGTLYPSTTSKPVKLFLLGDIKGTMEPCGCVSDPLGGIYRLGSLIRAQTRSAAGTATLAAGDLLFSRTAVTGLEAGQDLARAETVVAALSQVGLWASAVGELDQPRGAPPLERLSKSASFGFLSPGRLVERTVAGLRIAAIAAGPKDVLDAKVRRLRQTGVQIVVVLVHANRAAARAVATRTQGASFVLVGHSTRPHREPEKVGNVTLLEVGDLGQYVGIIELHGRKPGQRYIDGEPRREALRVARIRVAQMKKRVFVAKKHGKPAPTIQFYRKVLEQAQAAEQAERRRLHQSRPKDRNYFVWSLRRLDRSVPDDPKILVLRNAYKASLKRLNLEIAKRFPAPKAKRGAARYVGNSTCEGCHYQAAKFWATTKHSHAWETLVKDKSDYDLSCIGCHLTGYRKAGGSTLVERHDLRAVGCESCHGPGSLHEDAPEERKTKTIRRRVPERVCLQCHTPDHSDLFDYRKYLRHIIGPGHGAPHKKGKAARRVPRQKFDEKLRDGGH